MLAKDFKIGDRFKHINGDILEIVEIDGFKYFKNSNGDTFKYIDECNIFYKL